MKWGLIAILLVLIPLASAARIDEAITTATMDNQKVAITSQYVLIADGVQDLAVKLPSDVSSVNADMDDKARTCKIENATAYCGSTRPDKHVFTIRYDTKASLGSLDKRIVFKFDETLPFKANEHTFILKLPVGSVIPQEVGKESDFFLTPKPTDVLSDGQRIIVTWKTKSATSVSVSAVTEPLDAINWTLVIIITAIGALSGTGVTWYVLQKIKKPEKRPQKRKKEKKQVTAEVKPATEVKEAKPLVPQFIADEQKVVELVTKAQNQEVWQKQLLADTQFSKAKLSRIIRNLEERGVIVKTIYGNTNKISLKK